MTDASLEAIDDRPTLIFEPLSEADSLAAWPDAHERCAARFGVAPALGRRAVDPSPLPGNPPEVPVSPRCQA
jgi:hypothetical protein